MTRRLVISDSSDNDSISDHIPDSPQHQRARQRRRTQNRMGMNVEHQRQPRNNEIVDLEALSDGSSGDEEYHSSQDSEGSLRDFVISESDLDEEIESNEEEEDILSDDDIYDDGEDDDDDHDHDHDQYDDHDHDINEDDVEYDEEGNIIDYEWRPRQRQNDVNVNRTILTRSRTRRSTSS